MATSVKANCINDVAAAERAGERRRNIFDRNCSIFRFTFFYILFDFRICQARERLEFYIRIEKLIMFNLYESLRGPRWQVFHFILNKMMNEKVRKMISVFFLLIFESIWKSKDKKCCLKGLLKWTE